MISGLEINFAYDFSVHENTVLGPVFKGAILEGIVGYNTAKTTNIDTINAQMLAFLDDDVPRDHRKYNYYHFKVRGKSVYLAEWWIIKESIRPSGGTKYIIEIDNASESQISIIRDDLKNLGIIFTIK